MSKLLTIAIPTFNRAALLDRQLEWLSQAIVGCELECEILVSDNASSDGTPQVIHKWQQSLSSVKFRSNRHSENVGLLKNIAYCLTTAETPYVWAIGDDDPIQERAVSYVLNKLKQNSDIALIFLNYSGRNQATGEPVHPPAIADNRWFDIANELGQLDGKTVFEHCFSKSVGSVIFLTATVYRSSLVKQAMQAWQQASENWIFLAYLAGYCAARGQCIVTQAIYLECIVGVSYWQREGQAALLMQYKHIPEVLIKLEETGYSKQFSRQMIVKNLSSVNLKVFLGALKRWPWLTLKILIHFLFLLSYSAWYLLWIEQPKKQLDRLPT